MQVIWQREPVDLPADVVVAVGVFDGVHLGHQAVLAETRRRADRLGRAAVVVLCPSPAVRQGAPRLLTTVEQRLELIDGFGIDRCIVVNEGGTWPPPLSPDTVVHVPAVTIAGSDEPISSSHIRDVLTRGDVEGAGALLGRPYEVRGVVVHGDHRGRSIGFPTANLSLPEPVHLPADGVYGGWYEDHRGGVYRAAINLGRRPTFYDEGLRLLEAYVLDFDGDLYGDQGKIRFAVRLRDELKFDSVEDLVAQMHTDVDAVRRLGSRPTTRSADAVERAP